MMTLRGPSGSELPGKPVAPYWVGFADELLPDMSRLVARQVPNLFERLSGTAEAKEGASNLLFRAVAEECRRTLAGDPAHAALACFLMRRIHAQTFRAWLCLGLSQQFDELEAHLAEKTERAALLNSLNDPKAIARLAPDNAPEVEKKLFESDLGITLRCLTRQPAVAAD